MHVVKTVCLWYKPCAAQMFVEFGPIFGQKGLEFKADLWHLRCALAYGMGYGTPHSCAHTNYDK